MERLHLAERFFSVHEAIILMRPLIIWVMIVLALPAASPPVASPLAGDGDGGGDDYTCPVTIPADSGPPAEIDPFEDDDAIHHENGIWVTIPKDGILELSADQEVAFGPLQGWRTETVTWLRDEGVEGFVIVSGERLDTESELTPQTPLSPQRQYVRIGFVQTGIAFPSEGCWEVTGTVASPPAGDVTITWVVEVRFADPIEATPDA